MKGSYFVLGVLSLATLIGCATHTPGDLSRRDMTYSTHNYKHANKAAQARTWEGAAGVSVKPRNAREVALDNYKQQQPGTTPGGGVTVPHPPSTTVADRHYKTQNWMKTEPKPEVAKKRTPDTPTTGN